MRDKFATVAAVFVPLGFFGGWAEGGIAMGIGSAVLWAVVFALVRPK